MSRRLFIIALSAFLVFSCENSRLPLFQSETSSGVNFSVTPTSGVNYSFTYNFNLTLTPITDGDIVYYAKTDGTNPVDPSNNTVVWLKYEAPILIDSSITIQAYSISKDSSTTVSSEAVLICEKRDTSLFRYVDLGSGLDTNGGSLEAPYKTIQKGIDAVPSGGTVCVKAGVYNEALTITKGSFNLIGGFLDNWVLSPSLNSTQAGYTQVKAAPFTIAVTEPKDSKNSLFVSPTVNSSVNLRNMVFTAPNTVLNNGLSAAAVVLSSFLNASNCRFEGQKTSVTRGLVILDASPRFSYCFFSGGDTTNYNVNDESSAVYISGTSSTAPEFNTCRLEAKYSSQKSYGVRIEGANLSLGTIKANFNSCTIIGGTGAESAYGISASNMAALKLDSTTILAVKGTTFTVKKGIGLGLLSSNIEIVNSNIRTTEKDATSFLQSAVALDIDSTLLTETIAIGDALRPSTFTAGDVTAISGACSYGIRLKGDSFSLQNISVFGGNASNFLSESSGITAKANSIEIKNCNEIASSNSNTSNAIYIETLEDSAKSPVISLNNINKINAGSDTISGSTGISIINTYVKASKLSTFINRVKVYAGSSSLLAITATYGIKYSDSTLTDTSSFIVRNSIIHGGNTTNSLTDMGSGILIESNSAITGSIDNNTIFSGINSESDGIVCTPSAKHFKVDVKNNLIIAQRYAVRESTSTFSAINKLDYNVLASKTGAPLFDSVNSGVELIDINTKFLSSAVGNIGIDSTNTYLNFLSYIGLSADIADSASFFASTNVYKPVASSKVYPLLYIKGEDHSASYTDDFLNGSIRTGGILGTYTSGYSIGAIENDEAPVVVTP